MVSVLNLNSYIPPNATQNNFSQKKIGVTNSIPEKISPIEAISTQGSLNQYIEIAQENQNNKQSFVKRENLSYSAASALNQYTNNANLERTERTNMMLGLSLYA